MSENELEEPIGESEMREEEEERKEERKEEKMSLKHLFYN